MATTTTYHAEANPSMRPAYLLTARDWAHDAFLGRDTLVAERSIEITAAQYSVLVGRSAATHLSRADAERLERGWYLLGDGSVSEHYADR